MFETCTLEIQHISYGYIARIFIKQTNPNHETFQFSININQIYRIIYLENQNSIDLTHNVLNEEAREVRYEATCVFSKSRYNF